MADSTLTLVSPSRSSLLPAPAPPRLARDIKLTKRDHSIWALYKIGTLEEEIAARLDINVIAVQKSLLKWHEKRAASSQDLVDDRVRQMALDRLEDVDAFMRAELNAMKSILDDKGKVIGEEPDTHRRSKAAILLKEWVKTVQPRTPLIQQAITQNNQQNNFTDGLRGRSFEDRMREVEARHKQERQLPQAEATASDADSDDDADADDDIEEGELVDPELEGEVDPNELDDPDAADDLVEDDEG